MTTPTGSPAWVRTVSFADYGGSTAKRDFMGIGAINALTDVSAAQVSRMVSDLAAAVRTAPFAVITFLCNDGSPAAPTIESVYMMTGVRTVSYAGDNAPTGFPSAARNGSGDVTFTFDSSYNDEYGVAGAFTPRMAEATAQSSSARVAEPVISGQTIRVRVLDDAGAASTDQRVTLVVY